MLDVRHPWFDSFFRLLTAEHEACGQGNRLQEFDLFDRMGQLLLRRLIALQRHPGATDQPGRTAPLRTQLLRDVLAYIDRHLASKIVLDQLAAVASMCVDHFVRAFEQATGTTPHRWVLERRLEISRLRLRETTDAVGVIARECGFSGAAHFAAAFRRFHGTTPSAYRRGA
jgi:AraC family transcriptional regulator